MRCEGPQYYQQAALLNLAAAQYDLCRCYAYGIGVQKDDYESARYARLATDPNDPMGQQQLGMCYFTGK